jgi:hypothetical protein
VFLATQIWVFESVLICAAQGQLPLQLCSVEGVLLFFVNYGGVTVRIYRVLVSQSVLTVRDTVAGVVLKNIGLTVTGIV